MTYRGFDIREVQVRNATGYAVHSEQGLLWRGGSEANARAIIDKLNDPESRGVRE